MKALLIVSTLCVSPYSWAALIGTNVTGSLAFAGQTINRYDPVNGSIPVGSLNTAGTTVTIANPAVEFGFDDGFNLDTSNFTDTQLVFTAVTSNILGSPSIKLIFNDSAFIGRSLSLVSSSFAGLTSSMVGNTVTIDIESFGGIGSRAATFNILTSAPEPSSLVFVCIGAGLLTFAARRRSKNS